MTPNCLNPVPHFKGSQTNKKKSKKIKHLYCICLLQKQRYMRATARTAPLLVLCLSWGTGMQTYLSADWGTSFFHLATRLFAISPATSCFLKEFTVFPTPVSYKRTKQRNEWWMDTLYSYLLTSMSKFTGLNQQLKGKFVYLRESTSLFVSADIAWKVSDFLHIQSFCVHFTFAGVKHANCSFSRVISLVRDMFRLCW